MATKFPITQKQFREWVHATPNRRYGNGGKKCPLASALNALVKGPTWWVSSTSTYTEVSVLSPDYRSIPLPKWAYNFVHRYDHRKSGVKAVDLI